MRGEETQSARNLQGVIGRHRLVLRNPTDNQRRSGLRLIVRFHCRELGRLQPGDRARTQVAAEYLQWHGDTCKGKGETQRGSMKRIIPVAQQKKSMNCRHHKARRDKCRQSHVHDFVKRGGVQHRSDRVDVRNLSIVHFASGGRVHPRIRRNDVDA